MNNTNNTQPQPQNNIIARAQNSSKGVTSMQGKCDNLVREMGLIAALAITHDSFYALFCATFGGQPLARSVERSLRRSVQRLRK